MMPTEAGRDANEMHERARRLLAAGDPSAASALLEQAVVIAPRNLNFWLSLAAALRALKRPEAEFDALERALALDPTHLVVLLQKGALLDLMGKPRSAGVVYGHALRTLAPGTALPPQVQAHVQHAEKRVRENAAALSDLIDTRLASVRQADRADDQMRFDRCLDRLLGRRRIYTSDPTFMLFPFLRNYEFFPRSAAPWLEELESATEAIRDELLGVLADDQEGLEPYIAFAEGLPLRQWKDLNHSRRWSAYFLFNQGRREEAHLARCPRTAAALEKAAASGHRRAGTHGIFLDTRRPHKNSAAYRHRPTRESPFTFR